MTTEPATKWHTLQPGEKAFLLRSLETDTEAVMVTQPYRLTNRERWSWALGKVVRLPHYRAIERSGEGRLTG